MNYFKFIVYFALVIVSLNSNVNCNRYFSTSHSKFNPTVEILSSDTSPVVSYSAFESQQVENVQKPVVQESVKQEPVEEKPVKQEVSLINLIVMCILFKLN